MIADTIAIFVLVIAIATIFIDLILFLWIIKHCSIDVERRYVYHDWTGYDYIPYRAISILFYDTFIYISLKSWLILAYIPKKSYMTNKKRLILKEIRQDKKYKNHYEYVKSEINRYSFEQLRKWKENK